MIAHACTIRAAHCIAAALPLSACAHSFFWTPYHTLQWNDLQAMSGIMIYTKAWPKSASHKQEVVLYWREGMIQGLLMLREV